MRALARSERSADAVAALGAEPVRGDLDDVASMTEGARGCAVTFHLAAHLGQWGEPEEFERGNVTGTRNALEASEQAGVRRFVHCGTEAALMAGEPLVNVDETAPRRPDSKALYSATKARAEEAVIAANRERLRDAVDAAPLRVGRRRHHAPAEHPRDGQGRALHVDRRRRAPHRPSRTWTTWSRACMLDRRARPPGPGRTS